MTATYSLDRPSRTLSDAGGRRFDPARQQAEETVKLDPSDSSGHYLLGRIYQRLNRKELATEQFRMTAELIHDKNSNSPTGMASGTKSH